MKVTQWQIVKRGLANRCPNCGARALFRSGAWFTINETCPRCGLKIEREEGFFLGAVVFNYIVTFAVVLLPPVLLAYNEVIGMVPALLIAGAGSFLVPLLLFRPSRSWWLMCYYFFLPQHLPANRQPAADEDENT